MYYLVCVDHNGMAAHLTISDCEGFQEMPYIQCNWWNRCWCCEMSVKSMGMLVVVVRKMTVWTVKMETVTLNG